MLLFACYDVFVIIKISRNWTGSDIFPFLLIFLLSNFSNIPHLTCSSD